MAVSLAVLFSCVLRGRLVGCMSMAGNSTSDVSLLGYCCAESLKPVKQCWLRSAGDLVLALCCLPYFFSILRSILEPSLVWHQLQGFLWS